MTREVTGIEAGLIEVIKQLEADKAELVDVLREVVRISDRKHVARDKAKAALQKHGGNK